MVALPCSGEKRPTSYPIIENCGSGMIYPDPVTILILGTGVRLHGRSTKLQIRSAWISRKLSWRGRLLKMHFNMTIFQQKIQIIRNYTVSRRQFLNQIGPKTRGGNETPLPVLLPEPGSVMNYKDECPTPPPPSPGKEG
jgi:hypothetical protein